MLANQCRLVELKDVIGSMDIVNSTSWVSAGVGGDYYPSPAPSLPTKGEWVMQDACDVGPVLLDVHFLVTPQLRHPTTTVHVYVCSTGGGGAIDPLYVSGGNPVRAGDHTR